MTILGEAQSQNYISSVCADARALWNALNNLKAKQRQWNALNYSTTLSEGAGANEGLTAVEVGAVVFDTTNAIEAVLNDGHAANLAKLLML
jgi:hypothetical protein